MLRHLIIIAATILSIFAGNNELTAEEKQDLVSFMKAL